MELFGQQKIWYQAKKISMLIGKYSAPTTIPTQSRISVLRTRWQAKFWETKVFIFIQEKDSLRVMLLNCLIRKLFRQLKKNSLDFLDQVISLLEIPLLAIQHRKLCPWILKRIWLKSHKLIAISLFLILSISKSWFLNLSPILHLY